MRAANVFSLFAFAAIAVFGSPARAMDIVPYQAEGWHYRQVPLGDPLGTEFMNPSYDDSAWSLGRAAFADKWGYCLLGGVHVLWTPGTEMLLRRTFSADPSKPVTVWLAIDNDAKIYVNGVLVLEATHDGCTPLNNFSADVPPGVLSSGDNLLAVCGIDRGGSSYMDVRVEGEVSANCYDQMGNGFIGIYGNAAGTQSCINVSGSKVLYLIAVTAGATGDGITGAEFRVEVSDPDNYAYIYTAPAGAMTLGNPMDLTLGPDDAGFNIAFMGCRPETNPMPGDHVNLGTIRVINFGTGGPCTMLVKRKIPSSSPSYLCPFFALCDIPVYTVLCMTTQEGDPSLNGREPVAFRALINTPGCSPCNLEPPLPPPSMPPPIGLFADSLGLQTTLCADQGVLTKFYLVAAAPDFTPGGITGAEFRIEVSNPADYYFHYMPPQGATAIGDPFDLAPSDSTAWTGTSILFSSCQPATGSRTAGTRIGLGTVNVRSYSGATTQIRIRRKNPPDDPSMPCARFLLCDAPLFTPICAAPGSSSDIVYETTLNQPSCLPPPFTAETLQLDVHEWSNDGDAGPVSTNQLMDRRLKYLITVQGTVSLCSSTVWNSPPNVVCGIPERSPQMQSPGVTNYWVGSDAEIQFSAALPPGGDCDAQARHPSSFEIDLEQGFSHLEPFGGTPVDPAPGHLYRYLVNGHDHLASFRWRDSQTTDNYGILTITVEQANMTDVETSTRPGRVLMLGSVPNPFNPNTEIRYILPKSSPVTVGIFDIRGRMVRQLLAGLQEGGYKTVSWDGKLDDGRKAASGTYYSRVLTLEGIGVGKLTLIK